MKLPFVIITVAVLLNVSFAAAQPETSRLVNGAFSSGEFAGSVPEVFSGVWEGDDRLVVFAPEEHVSILLKTFYGWYLDRTAEPASFAKEPRALNNSTCPEAEQIRIEYRPVVQNGQSGSSPAAGGAEAGDGGHGGASVWELFVWYPALKEPAIVPVAIIGGNLYLDFALKMDVAQTAQSQQSSDDNSSASDAGDGLLGFWCSMAAADGVKASWPHIGTDIYSAYITPDAVYTIRYWLTDMEYTAERASFTDGEQTFSVVKHIQSGGKIYTCTSGRSVVIRNVKKSGRRPEIFELDSSAMICGLGKPYLHRVKEEDGLQTVAALANEASSRRAPNPDPPFEPSSLDFHMDEIYRLEEGNLIIQSLRERQKNWGTLNK